MMAQGKTSSEIAEELKLARGTGEAHRARMMRSTGIRKAVERMARFSTEMNRDVFNYFGGDWWLQPPDAASVSRPYPPIGPRCGASACVCA